MEASAGNASKMDIQAGGASEGEILQNRNREFWAARSAISRNRERGAPVSFFPLEQGADRVKISLDVWNAATGKFKNALVGFVFGLKPVLGRMRGFVRNKWGDEKVVKVSMLNDGIFLLNFATEEKKLEVMLGGPWTFDNRPFIMKEWKEEEEYKCGSVEALPVWVRLPGVKAHLTDPTILGQLCSRIGKPICTDGVTAEGTSYKFARICVEIYADQEMIDEIKYEYPYGNCYDQKVMYERRPPRCTNC